jgi:glycosyltransferase involved in cell wall biosynthesis
MKILHFIYDYTKNPWFGGGGSTRTAKIYEQISRYADTEVDIVVGNFPKAKKEYLSSRVTIIPVGYPAKSLLISILCYIVLSYVFLFKFRKKYDVIINDFSPYIPLILLSKKTICCIQNYFGTKTIRRYFLFGIVPFFAEKIVFRANKRFIAVSRFIANSIKQNNPKARIEIIPNGIDENLLTSTTVEANFILFLGRLDMFQKGIDFLIKAFSLYSAFYPHISLIIAGSGRDRPKLESLVKKLRLESKISFAGRVSEETKAKLLSECLFVVVPSRFEGMPIITLEAMAYGKPVIANDMPSLREVVIDGKTGILFEGLQEENLLRKMLLLTRNQKMRTEMGKAGRDFIKNFTWNRIADEFYGFIQEEMKRMEFTK